MNLGRSVFSQLMDQLPCYEFQKCVARYRGDYQQKKFSCWDQFLAMAFAQLTYRESLRDIEACLRSMSGKLYHMGFRSRVARSTLADANESRDWRIYADFAQVLIGIARPLYARDPIGVDLDQSLYALDSTTIDLCLTLFGWAKFRRHKAAVKMHTLLDLHGNIPTFISITDGKNARRQHPRRVRSRARRLRERLENADLDRRLGLRAGCDCAQEVGPRGESLPNPTDSQRYLIRENAHFTGLAAVRLP